MNYSTSDVDPTRASSAGALEVRLFGVPRLSWRGVPLHLSSQKGRALLYLLAANPAGLTREELAELLWGPGRYANVRQALYQLRQLPGAAQWLYDDERAGGEPVRVIARSDLGAFRTALRGEHYAEALALSEAPFLAGARVENAPAFEDWLEQYRASVEEARRGALRAEAGRLEELGDLGGALELTGRLTRLDPLDETSYRTAMRLLYRQGDVAGALAQFAECRRVLTCELGVEPLSETLELAHLLEKSGTQTLPERPATLPLQLLRPPHLVGREAVWRQLLEAQAAGQVIFLAGAAGVGKTRLLRDFSQHLGRHVFNEAKPGDVHSPYIVIARGLHRFLKAHPEVHLEPWERLALARLLPQHFPDYASDLTPSPLDTPGKQLRFTEAVTSLFMRMRRTVAALPTDDIHYIDSASHMLGAQVFGQLARDKDAAALVVAYRPEETPKDFGRYVAPLLESGVGVRVELEPLGEDAVGELLESLALPGGPDLARRLHRYAGGNPMLTLETLKSMMRTGDLRAAPMLEFSAKPDPRLDLSAPGQGSALIRRRLETLSGVALRVARAKALAQIDDVYLLADLVEMSPLAVAEGVEELQLAQVLTGESFVHDLLREAVLAGIPEALRRVLHERAALVLTSEGQVGKPERVAHHWLSSGSGAKAAPYLLQAALAAGRIRADEEARLRFFQVLWCTGDEVGGAEGRIRYQADQEAHHLRRRALKGLGALADQSYDLPLKRAVLAGLEYLGPLPYPKSGGRALIQRGAEIRA